MHAFHIVLADASYHRTVCVYCTATSLALWLQEANTIYLLYFTYDVRTMFVM